MTAVTDASDFDVLVVGAGIAGLAAARELEGRGRRVQLVEATHAAGGVMQTDALGGYVVERGPNTILMRPPMWQALQDWGLEALPIAAAPASRNRFVLRHGELVPVPLGPGALVRSPLLSARAKLRLLAEPFAGRGDGAAESVAEFTSRRLGPEVTRALVGPFLTGVYAGDEAQLGAEAVFPALVELEREHGSLVRGALARALRGPRAAQGRTGTFSVQGGLGVLSARLAEDLRTPPWFATSLRSLTPEAGAVRVGLVRSEGDGAREIEARARAVVLATPAQTTASLVAPFAPEAARAIEGIAYSTLR